MLFSGFLKSFSFFFPPVKVLKMTFSFDFKKFANISFSSPYVRIFFAYIFVNIIITKRKPYIYIYIYTHTHTHTHTLKKYTTAVLPTKPSSDDDWVQALFQGIIITIPGHSSSILWYHQIMWWECLIKMQTHCVILCYIHNFPAMKH